MGIRTLAKVQKTIGKTMFPDNGETHSKTIIKRVEMDAFWVIFGQVDQKGKKAIRIFTVPRRDPALFQKCKKPLVKQCFLTTEKRNQKTLKNLWEMDAFWVIFGKVIPKGQENH